VTNDPRDRIVTKDEDGDEAVMEVRRELAALLLDPSWSPTILVVGDDAAVRGEKPYVICATVSPIRFGELLHAVADNIAKHTGARKSYNRAERRRAEREEKRRG
jgi:hypothetical protein